MPELLLDAAGRRRPPATLPGYHAGRPPRNKGQRYPADPPTVEEIIAVMRQTTDDRHGRASPARRPGGRAAPVRAALAAPRHALELAREGVALNIIQRQLGHANLATTSIYLQGIDTEEIIAAVHGGPAPMMPASAGLDG